MATKYKKYMATLNIRNIGPIKEVWLELKRYNFFIGPQSSGKSTIAKIISNCLWMEKEIAVHPNKHNDMQYYESIFISQLENFHNMHGYFDNQSAFLSYESDYVKIVFENKSCRIQLGNRIKSYERTKILYIPAERNVLVFANNFNGDNNIDSFAFDWLNARDFYQRDSRFEILKLGLEYYQEQRNGKSISRIKSDEGDYDIQLTDASSGLQSVVPIATAVEFYTTVFYRTNIENKLLTAWQEKDRVEIKNFLTDELKKHETEKNKKAVNNRMERLLNTKRTSFVIEEPESNLYPTTQRDLLNFIIKSSCAGKRKNTVTITTHSPYIINQLNLLLKAFDSKEKIDGASIDFNELNVYALQNGTIRDLKVKNEGVHFIDTELLSEDINDIYNSYEQL